MGQKRKSKSQRKAKNQQKLRSAPSANYSIDVDAFFHPGGRQLDDEQGKRLQEATTQIKCFNKQEEQAKRKDDRDQIQVRDQHQDEDRVLVQKQLHENGQDNLQQITAIQSEISKNIESKSAQNHQNKKPKLSDGGEDQAGTGVQKQENIANLEILGSDNDLSDDCSTKNNTNLIPLSKWKTKYNKSLGVDDLPFDPTDPNTLILLPEKKKSKDKKASGASLAQRFGPRKQGKQLEKMSEIISKKKEKREKENKRIQMQYEKRKERQALLQQVATTNVKQDEDWIQMLKPSAKLGRKDHSTKREKLENELLREKFLPNQANDKADELIKTKHFDNHKRNRVGNEHNLIESNGNHNHGPSTSTNEDLDSKISYSSSVGSVSSSIPPHDQINSAGSSEHDSQNSTSCSLDDSMHSVADSGSQKVYQPQTIIPGHNIVVQDVPSLSQIAEPQDAHKQQQNLYHSLKLDPSTIKISTRVRKPRTLKVSRKEAQTMLNRKNTMENNDSDYIISSSEEDEKDEKDEEHDDEEDESSDDNEKNEVEDSESDRQDENIEKLGGEVQLDDPLKQPIVDFLRPSALNFHDELAFLKEPLSNMKPLIYRKHHVVVHRKKEIQYLRSKLPIYTKEQEIMEAISENDVVVITGSTGSGKTTQIPQFLYEAGYGDPRNTDHTMTGIVAVCEPRRVAAISCAARVAKELNVESSSMVGYQIRHDAHVKKHTRIKFATDGIILREIESDFLLKKYSAIIIDEVHERTLNTDLLLALLSRTIQLRRRDFENALDSKDAIGPLKLILMSATLEIDGLFKGTNSLFGPLNPPVINAESRLFPVTVHFSKNTTPDYVNAAFKKVCKIHRKLPPGGILVFLTGKLEVDLFCSRLRKRFKGESGTQRVRVYPLYSNMDETVKDSKLFENLSKQKDKKGRKIVVATNVAETSITIPDIVYIVDSGRVKERVFDGPVSSFQIKWITQASAEQRAGRAGRTAEGHCYRLYSSRIYEEFEKFQIPEIQRVPVDTIVLRLRALGITEIEKFPFPTKPDSSALRAANNLLKQLGLIDEENETLTRIGMALSLLPVSPRIGKLLLVGMQFSCTRYCARIAGVICCPEIFNLSHDNEDNAKVAAKAHSIFSHPMSEVLTKFRAICAAEFSSGGDSTKLGEFCRKNFLIFKTVKEALDISQQLEELLKRWGRFGEKDDEFLSETLPPPSTDQENNLRKAIFSGYPDQLAMRSLEGKRMENTFSTQLLPGENLYIHNLSPLRRNHDFEFFVFTDAIKSGGGKYIAQGSTIISKEWIAKLASGVCSFSALKGTVPRYDDKTDSVVCKMRVTYGPQRWNLGHAETSFHGNASERKNLLEYRVFAKAFLDGHVCRTFAPLCGVLCTSSESVMRDWGERRVAALVGCLARNNIKSRSSLQAKWHASNKFLFDELSMWFTDTKSGEMLRKMWDRLINEWKDLLNKDVVELTSDAVSCEGENEES